MDDELTFGQWLQRRRLALHLTQRQLADRARCSPDTIRKLEADERRPSSDIARHLAIALLLAWALHDAAYVADRRGELAQAQAACHESLQLMHNGNTLDGIAVCLAGCARVASSDGRPVRAARLLAAGEALEESLGGLVFPVYRSEQPKTVTGVRAVLDEATFAAAWAEGRGMTLEQAVGYALERI